jgi:hypothetical protein
LAKLSPATGFTVNTTPIVGIGASPFIKPTALKSGITLPRLSGVYIKFPLDPMETKLEV